MKFDLQRFAGVLTYDPKKVAIIFGARQITGFSEDDIITIEPSGEGMTKVVGADGEVARSIDPNETCKVTFHFFSRKEISIGDGNIYYVQQYPPFEGLTFKK